MLSVESEGFLVLDSNIGMHVLPLGMLNCVNEVDLDGLRLPHQKASKTPQD
jgi:hypothetical protein